MNEKMFCFQCQETAGCAGCKISGVCGKTPQVAHAQDLLIYVLKGLGVIANHHQHGCGHDYCDFRKSIHAFVNDALFCTITNANFDVESIYARIDKGLELRDMFKDRVTNKVTRSRLARPRLPKPTICPANMSSTRSDLSYPTASLQSSKRNNWPHVTAASWLALRKTVLKASPSAVFPRASSDSRTA